MAGNHKSRFIFSSIKVRVTGHQRSRDKRLPPRRANGIQHRGLTQAICVRGGGEVGSGRKEAGDSRGLATKSCEGATLSMCGREGNISATAR